MIHILYDNPPGPLLALCGITIEDMDEFTYLHEDVTNVDYWRWGEPTCESCLLLHMVNSDNTRKDKF